MTAWRMNYLPLRILYSGTFNGYPFSLRSIPNASALFLSGPLIWGSRPILWPESYGWLVLDTWRDLTRGLRTSSQLWRGLCDWS